MKWKNTLKDYKDTDDWKNLIDLLNKIYKTKTVYPPKEKIFDAFALCTFEETKVIILGQDPYHQKGQANGLAFSVNEDTSVPPSLQNIFKEIRNDIGKLVLKNGDLSPWANQGVFLLNALLSVEENKPSSHKNLGWECFTDYVIKQISEGKENVVFLLWGNFAKSKMSLIDEKKHLVLTASHPSPFSANSGFFGCKHFSKTNEYLEAHDKKTIEW